MLGAGAYVGFLAARLANLLVSLLMQATALAIARRGRVLLFATLLLPLSLSLDASVSQDGLLIGAAALAAACATTMQGRRPSSSPAWWLMTALIACITLAKPPYVPMAALLFLLSASSRRWRAPDELGLRVAALSIILLLTACWIWLTVRVAAAPIFRGPEEAGPLWPGSRPAIFTGTDMAAQLSVLTAHPLRFLTLPLHSIWSHPEIFAQMLGLLGWLNLQLPSALVSGWTVALLCAGCADMAGQRCADTGRSRKWDSMLLLLAVLATMLLIYQSQYLSFMPVGWDWVSGVQGRYLLPLLPLLALASPSGGGRPLLSRALGLPAVLAAAAGCCVIPLLLLRFYYMG